MAYDVGTPVLDHYDNPGFISAVLQPKTESFVIGATMRQVRNEYEVCFEPGRISTLPDGIIESFVERAAGLPKVENVEARKAEIQKLVAAKYEEEKRQRERADEARKAFLLEAEKRFPAGSKAVIIAEYMVDKSDSMTDYFNATPTRTVILGFSRHTRDLFPELRKFAATFKETADLADAPANAEHREKWSMGAGYYLKASHRYSDGWQVRKVNLYDGGAKSVPMGEWNEPEEPATVAAPAASVSGMRIEEHTHTKHGFTMFLAILSDRVEREEFESLLSRAKAFGGWYSRPWGKTPGGFAFKERDKAELFAEQAPATETATATATPSSPATPSGSATMAAKLSELADNLQGEIDHKFANRLTNTPKRQREADSARLEGYRLQRTQQALRALSVLHASGSVPAILAKVTTKAKVFELMRTEIDRSRAGYYDAGIDTGRPSLTTPEAVALWSLLSGQSEADKAAEALRRKVQSLQFANIPGYFPTPATIVAEMIEAADIPEGQAVSILEPEAGSGAILDAVKAARPMAKLTAIERHASLREVLQLKGYTLSGSDFMEADLLPVFDRVMMNPPFENGQDIEHVQRAFSCLKTGGKLVAIMSPGPFYRQDKKAAAFREWFEAVGGEKRDMPAGAFKESGTGVATVMVTIDRNQ